MVGLPPATRHPTDLFLVLRQPDQPLFQMDRSLLWE